MRALYPKEYSFYPTSFTIPNQLEEYIATFNKVQSTQSTITGHKAASSMESMESMESMDYSNNLWLMKPRARCCGEGIRIINNATQSADIVNPDLGEWYVQRFAL
jgi:6-phosphogluconate dehydrogenase (decarboxylating)